MQRIVKSLALLIGAVSVIGAGVTSSFFSDTERSTDNVFSAGEINLLVDNESYYNGVLNAGTTWEADNLEEGGITLHKFFDFLDLKPNDWGEDTISLRVDTNDSYLCADVTLTSNDDNDATEPESLVDLDTGEGLGELAGLVEFVWWADDGDNVFEVGEEVLSQGPIGALTMGEPFTVALADSVTNIWEDSPGPIEGGETFYIGKAWCFGEIGTLGLPSDEYPNPAADNNEDQLITPEDGGITCDGGGLGSESQTDSLTADVTFRAEQSRNNPEFRCTDRGGGGGPGAGTITVNKVVTNNNGGNNVIADFQLFVDATSVNNGETNPFAAGTYTVGETGVSGYEASFSGDCDENGEITVADGEDKVCTITNDDLPANITLVKNVINNNGGGAIATQFGLRVDGALVNNNTSVDVTSNSPHTINEDGRVGYVFVSITGSSECPAVLGGTATLDEGESITCTITNDDTGFSENFGTGDCLADIPGWTEDAGESCVNGTVAAAIGTGDNTASPDGGRFGLLSGNNGFICRSVNMTGLDNLQLKYYWRGDSAAEVGETGSIKLYTGGTCAAPTGQVSTTTHALTTTTWSALQTVNLPASLNNTTFLVKFTADTNGGNESFRVDGISITGSPI